MDHLSASTPYISKIHPSPGIPFYELHNAGGVPAILKSLELLVHTEERTVEGSIKDVIAQAEWNDADIIRPVENAFAPMDP